MRQLPLIILSLLLLTIGYGYYYHAPATPRSINQPSAANLEIASTTPETLDPTTTIGQHFMIGHWADSPVASTTELIRQYGIGGVIIMSAPSNPAEIRDWVNTWQAVSPTPLLIAIDQEGGPVSRLTGKEFTSTGQSTINDPATAYAVGYERGQELRALGINLNFSPVLDTAQNPDSFMFGRVFPKRDQSPALAAAMVQGLADAGVTAVVKHFPGHDDTNDDSHVMLPVVPHRGTKLEDFLSPFNTLLTTTPPAVLMTAHVAVPAMDPLPATLSPYWLTTYLRNTMHFHGVIVTDDMIMDAIDTTWPHETASVMALKAGADIILYAAEPHKVTSAIKTVQDALTTGDLPQDRALTSLERIKNLKMGLSE